MSKSATKHRRHHHSGSAHGPAHGPALSNIGPYVGFVIIWAFVTFIAYIAAREIWFVISIGLVGAFVMYVALCTSRAFAGQPLMQWQKGLVRLPLIVVGAGRERVNEVKGDRRVRVAIFLALALAVVLCAAAIWLLLGAI